jgi:uncharacterized protein (DUF1501 family)
MRAPHDGRSCDSCTPGAKRPRLSRRDFLYVGVLGGIGGLGLTLSAALRHEALAKPKDYPSAENVAKSVIHIFLPGGIAAQESFDPKPYAPVEYRGPFGTVKTKIPGVLFSEHLQRTAEVADRLAICRSMTHGEAAHERGTHNMFTGYRPSPAVIYPSFGSIVAHELGPRGEMPPYVCVPAQPNPYAGSGYLSTKFGPFSLGADPERGDFQVRDLSLPPDVDHERFQRRQRMLDAVDDHFKRLEKSDALEAMDTFYARAYAMISSPKAREAFNLAAEPDAMRDAYGRNAAGMRLLLCRRLVEGGVRFMSVVYGGWDHHVDIRGGVAAQLPAFDQAFAALILDLERRGLLDSTLVLVTTEFGRTPKINNDGGRDHWPRVFSVVMAGGGIKKGVAYGTTDATATAPDTDPLTVADFATTVYNQIGINADKELMSPGDRPVEIVDGGTTIKELVEKGA